MSAPIEAEAKREWGRRARRASTALALLSGLLALPTASAQTPGDVLVVGQAAEPKALDPHVVTSLNDFRILANVFDGLVRYRSGSLEIEPALATSWEVEDSGRRYVFHLRKGVRFHDGTAFDAEAVRFNFERMLDGEHPYHDTGPFPLAFFFEAIKKIEVRDPHTAVLHLDEPFAPLISNLAYPTGFIVSPAAVKASGKGFARQPVGTGPFRFQSWDSGIKVVVERNEAYWDGAPPLRAVVFRPFVDANTRVMEMLSGGIDLMVEVPADIVPVAREEANLRVHQQVGPHLWFLILNLREGPFTDKRMRQAVNYAVDKQGLVEKVLQGTATVAAGPVPRAFGWAYDESLEPYPHAPQKARQLIEAAGRTGAKLTLLATEGGSGMLEPIAMATAIQADLAAVGLDVTIESFEWNTYLDKVNGGLEGQGDMAEMAWMTNDPDTLPYLALRSQAWPEEGGFNSGYYENPEVDRLVEVGRRTTDRAKRADIYKRIQRIVHEDAPWLFVASWRQNALSSARVSNFRLEPSFLLRLHKVRKD